MTGEQSDSSESPINRTTENDIEPVGAREVKPPRRILTHLTKCRTEGHEPTEWLPRVSSYNGEVRGRVQYCRDCGKRLDSDHFRTDPKTSYVFVDKPWYPERLSCYDTDEPPIECGACGGTAPALSIHATMHVQECDFRSPHHAERETEDHYLEVCPECWNRIAEELAIETLEVTSVVE